MIAKMYPNLKFQIAWISADYDQWEQLNIKLVDSENHPEMVRFKSAEYTGDLPTRCFRLAV